MEKTLIIKMQRRLLKAAFAQFVEKSKLVRGDQNGVKKAQDYNHILTYNAKKRMFNAMKTFIRNFRNAKVNFRRVYRNSDYRAKKSYFYVWKNDYYQERDDSNNEMITAKVETVQESFNEYGERNDAHLEVSNKNKALNAQLQGLGRKTLAKVISRWRRY